MKLIFLLVATVLLCSVLTAESRPQQRRRVIHIRIIRIIPIRRRGRRDVGPEPLSAIKTGHDVVTPNYELAEVEPSVEDPVAINIVAGGDNLSSEDLQSLRSTLNDALKAHQVPADAEVDVEIEPENDVEPSLNASDEENNSHLETVWDVVKANEA